MTSEELNKNKKAYEEMFSVLKKYEDLPSVDAALYRINECLKECKAYTRWGVNKQHWDRGYFYGLPWGADIITTKHISDQNGKVKCLSKSTKFFVVRFPSGAYILGADYPEQLFGKFFEELIEHTNPEYVVNSPCNELYYTENTAGNAHKVILEIYKKYKEKYASESKAREIEQLKERLAELENEQNEQNG